MPVDLVGVNRDAEFGSLYSYGMLFVELQSPEGKILNIANNKFVTISRTIPEEMKSEAPSEVKFWYFDESNGLWREYDAPATKNGDVYEVQVPHFTKLNWDDWKKPCYIYGKCYIPADCCDGICSDSKQLTLPDATVRIHLDTPNGRVIQSAKTNSLSRS